MTPPLPSLAVELLVSPPTPEAVVPVAVLEKEPLLVFAPLVPLVPLVPPAPPMVEPVVPLPVVAVEPFTVVGPTELASKLGVIGLPSPGSESEDPQAKHQPTPSIRQHSENLIEGKG